MSLCGNCPIPYHEDMDPDKDCPYECTYQDAVYKTQKAFWELLEEYEKLQMRIINTHSYDTADDYCE